MKLRSVFTILVFLITTSAFGYDSPYTFKFNAKDAKWEKIPGFVYLIKRHDLIPLSGNKLAVFGGNGYQSVGEELEDFANTGVYIYSQGKKEWNFIETNTGVVDAVTAFELPSGKVLVSNGTNSQVIDLRNRKTLDLTPPTEDRWLASLTQLKDGSVLMYGGYKKHPMAPLIYLESVGDWQKLAVPPYGGYLSSVVEMKDGRILVTGGADNNKVTRNIQIYDPKTNTWTMSPAMQMPRFAHDSLILKNGKILLTGGSNDYSQSSCSDEIYDPKTNTSMLLPMGTGCHGTSAEVTWSQKWGYVIAAGYVHARGYSNEVRRFNEKTLKWEALPDMPYSAEKPFACNWGYGMTADKSGDLFLVGGYPGNCGEF